MGKISARDEKGQALPAWILASVVDERLQNLPRSLSAHFFLLNEIRTGADLDNAQLILHDSAESCEVLDASWAPTAGAVSFAAMKRRWATRNYPWSR